MIVCDMCDVFLCPVSSLVLPRRLPLALQCPSPLSHFSQAHNVRLCFFFNDCCEILVHPRKMLLGLP